MKASRPSNGAFPDKRTGTTHNIMNRGENGKDTPGFFFRGCTFSSPVTLYVRSEANDHVIQDQPTMTNFIL